MPEPKHLNLPYWSFIALFLAYFLFFFWNLGSVSKPVWDETFYLNAARAYLSHWGPLPNPEHPPLVKHLIAMGIDLFGDRPEGWRFFSVLSGALTNVCTVYLIDRIGKHRGVALFMAACLFLDPLLLVHFRLAILEGPLAAWMMLALALAISIEKGGRWLGIRIPLLGLLMGLGLASKWSMAAVFPSIIVLIFWTLRQRKVSGGIWILAGLSLFLLPLATLAGSYAILGFSFGQTLEILRFGFQFHRHYQLAAVIGSPWYEWLYSGQPLWYVHQRLPEGYSRAIMATGNLVLWISAQCLSLYALWSRRRSLEVWVVAAVLGFQFLLFASKPLTFLHYMVGILPLLYTLMGIGIAALFDRFGGRYRRILQFDLALLFLGALLVTWHYAPFLWGWPVPEERLRGLSRSFPAESPQP